MLLRILIGFLSIFLLAGNAYSQTLTVSLPKNQTPSEAAFAEDFFGQLHKQGYAVKLKFFNHEFGTFPDQAAETDLTVILLARLASKAQTDDAATALLSYPLIAVGAAERAAALGSEVASIAASKLGRDGSFPIGFFGGADEALFTVPQTRTAEELKGLKIRVFNPVASQFFADLGVVAIPTTHATEIYTAMAKGAIDGAETSFGEVAGYLSSSTMAGSTVWPQFRSNTGLVLVSSKSWDALSPRQHRKIEVAFNTAVSRNLISSSIENDELLKAYQGTGFVQFVSTKVREDTVKKARESFLDRYGEEGKVMLQLLESAIEQAQKPDGKDDRGSVGADGSRVFFVTDRRHFPQEQRLVDQFGAVPTAAPRLRCGELVLDTAQANLGSYDGASIGLKLPELEERRERCLDLLKSSGREVIVFIHGYNTSFEEAASRILSLARDLDLPTTDFLLWSWPSAGKPGAYSKDAKAVERSALRFIKFLRGWQRDDAGLKPLIIAHSMGSRIVGMTAEQMQRAADTFTFVLAAADVSEETFRKQITGSNAKTVLYVSSQDRVLWLSKVWNSRRAIGGSRPIDIDNVEVVDLSQRYGDHSHVFVSPGAFDDLKEFVGTRSSPIDRGLVKRRDERGSVYWELPTSN